MGPMTGRQAGFCAGAGMAGYAHSMPGRGTGRGPGGGYGRGRGGCGVGGRGWRNLFRATGLTGWQRAAGRPWAGGMLPAYGEPPTAGALDALRHQAESFEKALGEIRRRIGELEADKAKG